MKQFNLLIRVPESYGITLAKKAHPKWDELIKQWKWENSYITSYTFPGLSYTISGVEKAVKKEVVLSDGLKAVSNVILQAYTMQDALELAKHCPILLYGGTVEVREVTDPIQVR